MQSRLESPQPGLAKEEDVACRYAKSDKYWVTDPSGLAWETFHTLDSIPVWGESHAEQTPVSSGCCAPVAVPLMPMKRTAAGPSCIPADGQPASAGKCC